MPFANNQRITRRRSSAGPTPPKRPLGNNSEFSGRQAQGPRPTFLTLGIMGKFLWLIYQICPMVN